ncbi:MAG: carboxypeptidase-like regulatory domain-containing protein [Bacteroidetes bacterium]|nr:carboxypeptidase-like regulatory domain-containing protein [Bacteroidota bacterium]
MRSSEYTLGNRDTTIHVILKPKHYKVSIITGAIRTVPVETIGKIKHEVDLLEILKNKAAICGLEVKDEKTKETASKITISGTIRDEAQLILPGVNVLIKGTSKGTQTDFKGNYSIETEPNSVLEFSFLGYENKEIALSNISNEVSFSMTPNFEELAGTIGFMIIREESSMYVDPYARDSYLDHDQRSNRKRRKEYAAKENAFKKIKRSRDKAARLIKRALKNKK